MYGSLADLDRALTQGAGSTTQNRQPDAWDRAAQENGMTTEAYISKVASERAALEVAMEKKASDNHYLGACMADEYYNTIHKVAHAHPVRDEIPIHLIKAAREIRVGLIRDMLKVGYAKDQADAMLARIDPILKTQL